MAAKRARGECERPDASARGDDARCLLDHGAVTHAAATSQSVAERTGQATYIRNAATGRTSRGREPERALKSSNGGRLVARTAPMHQSGASTTTYTRFVCPPWHQPSPQNVHAHRTAPARRLRSGAHTIQRRTATTSCSKTNPAQRGGKSVLESIDLWTVLRTGWLAVDNDEAVIHRAHLCPQAPHDTNYFQ